MCPFGGSLLAMNKEEIDSLVAGANHVAQGLQNQITLIQEEEQNIYFPALVGLATVAGQQGESLGEHALAIADLNEKVDVTYGNRFLLHEQAIGRLNQRTAALEKLTSPLKTPFPWRKALLLAAPATIAFSQSKQGKIATNICAKNWIPLTGCIYSGIFLHDVIKKNPLPPKQRKLAMFASAVVGVGALGLAAFSIKNNFEHEEDDNLKLIAAGTAGIFGAWSFWRAGGVE